MRPAARSRSCSSSSGSSDCGSSSIPLHGSPTAVEPPGHTRDRQLVRVQRLDLVPGQRRRHLRARPSAHRPRAEHRLVRRVLVVVDEDALPALLLPPRGGDQLGPAPFELARGRDRRGTHLVRVPARLEPGRRRAGRDSPSSSGGRRSRARRATRGARRPRPGCRRSRRPAAGRGRGGARRRRRDGRLGTARRESRGRRGSPPRGRAPCRRGRARARSSRSAC